ncbi:substrate-binding periplasmic protein [Zooshikella ganghwensis]|uniref:substrate-binding periplasmic protein n=1 Tax=Zooshikella ganghwensis TaxID=202772 RepID=UPI0013FD58EA|nr:transporter substrate-binding domain-containing protein [Zooshikella ganghwensis]
MGKGYRATLEEPDHVLFATTRTKEREPLFKWAGPIAKTKIVLLAKNDNDVKINTPEDIAKYPVGTIRDDVGEQLVKALGVPESMIKPSSNADSLVKKLNTGRVDLWAYEENVARWFIKKNNLQNSDFSVVYTLKEAELFYAFSKKTSDDLINQLQKGIDEVKKTKGQISDTLYNDILSEYL